MKERFLALMHRLGDGGSPEEEYARLVRWYSEPSRCYHTARHIERCLGELDFASDALQHPDLVELALWFHDSAYDPHAQDNEEQSAQRAFDFCQRSRISIEDAELVRDLILATRHVHLPEAPDARFLLDIDLAIFGQSPEEFAEFEEQIRREYGWVPEEEFRSGRSDVLRMFLERDSVYLTFPFRHRYEDQARINLQTALMHRYGVTYLCRSRR